MKKDNMISLALAASLSAALVTGCATSSEKDAKGEAKEKKSALTTSQLPSPVQQVFQAKFPAAGAVEWILKSDHNYEAEFKLQGTEISAKFDPAGKWLETEKAIPQSELPQPVQHTADTQFKGYKVTETQTLQSADANSLAYELHLDNAKEVVKAVFSADGALVKQSAKPKTTKQD